MTYLIKKLLGLYTKIRHYQVPADLRYYCRDTYYCKVTDLGYFIRDYFVKKQYKVISFQGEFAPELQFVLPFAYWHFKNGTLRQTRSSKFTSELYFFSPDHREVFEQRLPEANYNFEVPRVLYSHDYDMSKWEPVPLKDRYKNPVYVFEKPLLIIANRYNTEWDGPPISFIGLALLDDIINRVKDRFTIVYNRPHAANITGDNSAIYDLNEYDWLRKAHPDVILMNDLFAENKGGARNFNHLQLMIYANADHFISVHGGTAALASYFGGTNIILSKKGPEHYFDCYNKLYPKLSGARIHHVKTDDELLEKVDHLFAAEM